MIVRPEPFVAAKPIKLAFVEIFDEPLRGTNRRASYMFQQDALLPAVEDGTLTLIGATTENPFFEVNAPLRR